MFVFYSFWQWGEVGEKKFFFWKEIIIVYQIWLSIHDHKEYFFFFNHYPFLEGSIPRWIEWGDRLRQSFRKEKPNIKSSVNFFIRIFMHILLNALDLTRIYIFLLISVKSYWILLWHALCCQCIFKISALCKFGLIFVIFFYYTHKYGNFCIFLL